MSSKLPTRREKPHSTKPYDRPKSFLQRVTKHVANYLPSWLNPTSWVVSSPPLEEQQSHEYAVADEETGEETEEDCDVAGLSEQNRPAVQASSLSRTTPGLTSPGNASFTRKPLERTSPTPQQIIANGDDHSDNSETSASTSGCSSLAPSQDRKRAMTSENRVGSHLKGLQVSKHHLEKIQQQLNSNPLFSIPGKETVQQILPVPPSDRMTDSVSVNNAPGSQKTKERSQKRVSVENYRPVENVVEKDVESSSTRTSLWSEDDKNSETNKRPRTTRPQAVAPNKRPCFSVSAFGSPLRWRGRQNADCSSSPVPLDRTRQSSESSTSPFCESRPMYGGAATYKKARISTPYNSVLHAEALKVRHSGSREVLSSAAQKVLNVLENMSTPLTDAKKIPVENVTRDFALSYTPSVYARRPLRKDTPRPQVSPFGPPRTCFPVPTSCSPQPTPLLTMLNQTTTPTRNVDLEARVSRTESGEIGKRSTGAVRTRVGPSLRVSKHQKLLEEQPAPQPDLPRIPLIPEESLPSVSFSIPVLTSTPIVEAHPAAIKKVPTHLPPQDKEPAVKFTFSSPIHNKPLEHVSEDSTSVKESNFQFRSPVFKAVTVPVSCPTSKVPEVNFSFVAPGGAAFSTSPLRRKKPVEQSTEETAGAALKTVPELLVGGSVMDILGKPASGAKEKQVSHEKTGFGSAFQKKATEWECSECMVRNKDGDSVCVACTTPRPTVKSTDGGFGKRFAPPSTSWCCPTCMVNNMETDVTCVACSELKPGSTKPHATTPTPTTVGFKVPASPSKLITSFAVKPSGKWECDTCLVRNDEGLSKCAACETQRPGAATTAAGVKETFSGFKFGQPKDTTTATSSSPFKFGLSDKLSTKPLTSSAVFGLKAEEVKNGDTQNTAPFKFAVPVSLEPAKSTEGFKFGSSTESAKPSEGFKFGVTSSEAPKLPEGFKFGLPIDKTSGSTTESGFKFGTSSESGFKFGSSTNSATSASTMFKFGVPNDPVQKAQAVKEPEVAEVTRDADSSLSASNKKVEDEPSNAETKSPSKNFGFVFGGQPASESKLETTPVLTFGEKNPEALKVPQGTFSFGKSQFTQQSDVTVSAQPNSEVKVSESFAATVSKPSDSTFCVTQSSIAPPVTESIGSKAAFSGFKFGAGTQVEQNSVAPNTTGMSADKTPAVSMFKFGGQGTSDSTDKKLPGIGGVAAASAVPSGLQFNFKGKDSDSSQVKPVASIFGSTQVTNVASASLPAFTSTTSHASVPGFGGIVSHPLGSLHPPTSTTVGLPTTVNSSAAVSTGGTTSSVAGFVFGTSTPAAQAPAPNPGSFKFTFGNDGAKQVSFFGSTPSTTSSVPPSSTPFSFGKPSQAPAPGSMVQQQPQQQQPVSMFNFGSAASSVNTSNSGGSAFGSGPAQKPVFGFNRPPASGAGAAPAFGQQAAPSNEPFRFGATPAVANPAAPSAGGMFQMEAPKPTLQAPSNTAQSSLFIFGAPQPENVANQQPMFGANQLPPSGFNFGSPAVPPMGSTFAQADSSTGNNAAFVFGSPATNTGVNPTQPAAAGTPFSFQPNNAAAPNPFNVTGNSRLVRRATRRLGPSKKK